MGNGSGVSRGDRNRNERLARLRGLVPVTNAIVGIDLADAKQMVVVTDHDSKVLARYLAPLEDITAVAQIGSPVLTELVLASCRWITSLSAMSSLIGLRRLDVSEGGIIESLKPIADLRLLEQLYLYGSTKIADGDLTPLLGMTRMRDLRIMNRRHYVPSTQIVQARLGLAR
jgi:hypothetical protein